MSELLIRLHSHHFVVSRVTPRARPAITHFARRFVQPLKQKPSPYSKKPPPKPPVYASYCDNTGEYRFHINTYKSFQESLAYFRLKDGLVEIETVPIPEAEKIELTISKMWTVDRQLFDYQEEGIHYVVDQPLPVSKLIDFQTGKGKGVTSLIAVARLGIRPCIFVKPMYMEKWVDEIREVYEIEIEDLMVIRKGSHLKALTEMAAEGLLTSKLVLISSQLMADWMKFYKELGEQTLDLGYACRPHEIMGTLKAGFRLIDEVHQDFHRNFLIDLNTHCQLSLSLSATLTKEDDFVRDMQEIAYPTITRHKGPAYDRYANATAVFYRLHDPGKVKFQDPMTKNYSHHIFEKYVMSRGDVLSNYLSMINQIVKAKFLKDYKPTEKLIIFCASIEFCTVLTDYMRKLYPQFDVRRYVEEDPFENVIDADIRVTTILSAGTAVDIKNLTVNIMTTAVSSVQANLQCFGRLRKLKSARVPEFLYLVCSDISKQVGYFEKKQELLRSRALSHSVIHLPSPI